MKKVYGILLFLSLIFWSSCRKDFDTLPSSGNLSFSKDTVYLDTVFTQTASSTYRLTVYNRSKEDIHIPEIKLAQGEASKYRLNVDGLPGKKFSNIPIYAKDSIFVFIETTAAIKDFTNSATQFLYTDELIFSGTEKEQSVELVTLIQDAHFLYPEKFADGSTETLSFGFDDEGNEILISGFLLDDTELNFTNEKPYVIYGYAAVPPQKTLHIDAGARLHFHQQSGILVSNQASLQAKGLLSTDLEKMENEIIMEGNRLEPEFSEVPGQWGALWFIQGSTNNIIEHTTIKNSSVGIRVDGNDGSNTPTLKVNNTQIYNVSNIGLLARTGYVTAENLVINNCGQMALNLSLGGNYQFNNCTFANYWRQGFRQFPAVFIENVLETPNQLFLAPLEKADFTNCIIYGNESRELLFNAHPDADFNFKFENTLIKFRDFQNKYTDDPMYNFTDSNLYTQIKLNEDPDFKDSTLNQLQIGEESAANGLANPVTSSNIDILGMQRDGNLPDSGAYESSSFTD